MGKVIQVHMQITGEFITEKVRSLMMEHKLTLANEIFDCLIPKPTDENKKAVLLGHAEFIGMTICDKPECDQCKGEQRFAMVFKEDISYQKELEKHKRYINEMFIEIDGDMAVSKKVIFDITEKQSHYNQLKKRRKQDYDLREDLTIKRKIVDADDQLEFAIDSLYQEFGVNRNTEYEIGSRQWLTKLEVDGLLELIKARRLTNRELSDLISNAKEKGVSEVNMDIRNKKYVESFMESMNEIKKKVKPSKKTVKIGKFSVPENLLNDYVESVKSMRTSMILSSARMDPTIGSNALALRMKRHKAIFDALKITYHQEENATKKSRELYSVVEKYIETKYPELSLANVGKEIKKNLAKNKKAKNEDISDV